ncbi:RDD family protein [Puia sp. P3]|uniref:RDD family protein n=1 Tax=Puia sp. P3 TaxID=3423952 RepID=UPI003D6756A7
MTDFQEDILTDVLLEPKTASIGSRIGAAIVDTLILWGIDFVIGLAAGQAHYSYFSYGFSLTGLPAVLSMVVWLLLIPVLEGSTGQTLGKRVLRIQVIHERSNAPSIGFSIIRHLFDIVDCLFWSV